MELNKTYENMEELYDGNNCDAKSQAPDLAPIKPVIKNNPATALRLTPEHETELIWFLFNNMELIIDEWNACIPWSKLRRDLNHLDFINYIYSNSFIFNTVMKIIVTSSKIDNKVKTHFSFISFLSTPSYKCLHCNQNISKTEPAPCCNKCKRNNLRPKLCRNCLQIMRTEYSCALCWCRIINK